MSNNITGDDGISFSSDEEVEQHKDNIDDDQLPQSQLLGSGPASTNDNGSTSQQAKKKKRNLPGTPDPKAEVVALSPTTLMAKNRFICEICNKGFQRDQNLQLHRRGHNLPWKLKQRTTTEVTKRVYICPDPKCVHHNPARALGDLTGIKKHFSRKHGEKKWKCDKCSKKYAVHSDWKAHHKACGSREYKCDCGTIFSRRDSFITHRAFCDALSQENCRVKVIQGITGSMSMGPDSEAQMHTTNKTNMGAQDFTPIPLIKPMNMTDMFCRPSSSSGLQLSSNSGQSGYSFHPDNKVGHNNSGSSNMSATALLQKAAQMGATASNSMTQKAIISSMAGPEQISGPRPMSDTHAFDSFQSPNYKSPLSDMMMHSGMMGRSPARLDGDAMMTVDFLGVGGSGPQDLHDQILDLEVMNRRRMQALMHNNDDPFHQQDSRN